MHTIRRHLERKGVAIFISHELCTAQFLIKSLITCGYSEGPAHLDSGSLVDKLQRMPVGIGIDFQFEASEHSAKVREHCGIERGIDFKIFSLFRSHGSDGCSHRYRL